MPSKQQTNPDALSGACRLSRFEGLGLLGRDALDFLQRQSMNDVGELDAVGRWHWNGLLSAKGRVLALFAALRVADDGVWLLLPDGDAAHWAATLQRLLFRSRVQVAPLAGLHATGVCGLPPPGASRNLAVEIDGGWVLDMGSPGRERQLRIATHASEPAEAPAQITEDAWVAENLRHGLPRLPAEQRDRHTPQMLGLERLAAYSVKKGCYPGQEIVARTHFLGQAKRSLARLAAPRPLLAADRVHCGTFESTMLDYADDGSEHVGVAILPLEPAAEACRLGDGSALIRMPFLDGLARRSG
jgi:tRNA-modifying protein YgfZ